MSNYERFPTMKQLRGAPTTELLQRSNYNGATTLDLLQRASVMSFYNRATPTEQLQCENRREQLRWSSNNGAPAKSNENEQVDGSSYNGSIIMGRE